LDVTTCSVLDKYQNFDKSIYEISRRHNITFYAPETIWSLMLITCNFFSYLVLIFQKIFSLCRAR